MSGYLTILLGIILVNNYVLAQFLGICPFLGVSKKLDSAVGMGAAVIFVMVLATAVTWPIMQVLNDLNIAYLQTIVFILIIAALVQFVEMALKKIYPCAPQIAGRIPAAYHYKLRGTGRMYFQHRPGIQFPSVIS